MSEFLVVAILDIPLGFGFFNATGAGTQTLGKTSVHRLLVVFDSSTGAC
jgi:uncharacterized membrane protein YtjA (UPF0391 family)